MTDGLVTVILLTFAWRNIAAASNNNQYVEEIQMRDFKCSVSTTDIGVTRSVTHCGKKCLSTNSCNTFFYNSQLQTCSISPVMYDSTSGCLAETGTKYYRKNETVYDSSCMTDADCWMSNMVCQGGVCQCAQWFLYDQTTGKCGTSCTTYGTSYSVYHNTAVNVLYLEVTVSSLQECVDECSMYSPCRGFSFCCGTTGPYCRLKYETPATTPGSEEYFSGVDYYLRNCA